MGQVVPWNVKSWPEELRILLLFPPRMIIQLYGAQRVVSAHSFVYSGYGSLECLPSAQRGVAEQASAIVNLWHERGHVGQISESSNAGPIALLGCVWHGVATLGPTVLVHTFMCCCARFKYVSAFGMVSRPRVLLCPDRQSHCWKACVCVRMKWSANSLSALWVCWASWYDPLYYVISYFILYYIISYYIILYCVLFCYILLYYIIFYSG